MSRLGEFLQSPFCNKSKDCLLLFLHLQKYAPSFEHRHISRETILKKLDVEKPLDEKSLAHLSSRLLALVEKFLALESFLADPWKQQLALLQEYHTLALPKHYKAVRVAAEKSLEAFPYHNADRYREQYLFERLQYEHSDRNQRAFNERLQSASAALDAWLVAEKLRDACEMLNYEAVLNIRYEISFLDELLQWSATPVFADMPVIQVYRQLVLLLQNPDEPGYFEKARALVTGADRCFDPEEQRALYTLLLNYCTRRINRFNDIHFLQEHLEINKLLLNNGLIFESSLLPPWKYTNIATAGLKTGQYDWTWRFIHDYRNRLPAGYAENVFRYNLAQYHYYLKEYDDAQKALLHVEISDVLLNVAVRSLLIKVYCETGQDELLLSYLEATRLFLHRNRLMDTHLKKQMQKFVECTARFVKTPPFDRERFQTLLDALPPASEMMHREWLSAQLMQKLKAM